jgi:hypothetical protein
MSVPSTEQQAEQRQAALRAAPQDGKLQKIKVGKELDTYGEHTSGRRAERTAAALGAIVRERGGGTVTDTSRFQGLQASEGGALAKGASKGASKVAKEMIAVEGASKVAKVASARPPTLQMVDRDTCRKLVVSTDKSPVLQCKHDPETAEQTHRLLDGLKTMLAQVLEAQQEQQKEIQELKQRMQGKPRNVGYPV